MREQLRASAAAWQDRSRPDGLLWRGDAFADLERWTRRTSALSEPEASFVAASRRYVRRSVWIKRSLVVAAIATMLGGFEYRSSLQTKMAEQLVTQSEVEQGRQALIHDDSAEAQTHLTEAYRRGERSSSLAFMLARALQPRQAEIARFHASSGRMWSATFSPDGERIVATDDHQASVWEAHSRKLLFALPHKDTVFHAIYSPDGSWIVTAGGDGLVKIWNAARGTLIRELSYDTEDDKHVRYSLVAISPDNRLIAAIDWFGKVVHVWDACTGARLADLSGDGAEFPSLAFAADGSWLATGGGDDVRVFDTRRWSQSVTLAGPNIRAVSVDPTGSRLVTGSATGDVAIWAIPTGERIRHLREFGEPIDAVAFSANGKLVVTASRDGAEQIWDSGSGRLLSQNNYLRSKIQSVEFDATSKLVLAAGTNGVVVVSESALEMPLAVLDGPRNVVRTAHFDPSSSRVVGASWDGTVRLWDATSPYRVWRSPPISDDCGLATAPEPDRRFVAIGCRDSATRVWDSASGQLVAELPSIKHVDGDFMSAFPAVSAAGDRAAIARGNTVEIYELPSGRQIRTITHTAAVNTVAFAASGHDIVSGDVGGGLLVTRDQRELLQLPASTAGIDIAAILADGRVVAADVNGDLRVYDAAGKMLANFTLSTRVMMLRSSPDGHRLITIPTYSVKTTPPILWDLERYRPIAQLDGHVGRVFSARFADSGEIITAGGDGAVRRWDGATGRIRQTYRGSSRFLADAMLYPDGSIVVAGGGDGLVRFWDASSGRLLWTLQAHKSHVIGLHFEGDTIVTRGFSGDVARWRLPTLDDVIAACEACDIGTPKREFGIVQQ